MSMNLNTLRQNLSKQMDDYWASTTTSAGNADKLDLIDSLLMQYPNDWLADGTHNTIQSTVLITDATLNKEERGVDSDLLVIATGTVGVKSAFNALIGSGKTYEINRLFTAAEKERAIKWACYNVYPSLYKLVADESFRFGDWLRDGDFEVWTSATALTRWSKNGSATLARESGIVFSGTYSCKISGAADYIWQGWRPTGTSNNADMRHLAGQSVTFRVWAYSATGSALTIAIYDGTTTTYGNHTSHSSATKVYHPGDSTWRLMEVTAAIQDNPTAVEVRIYNDTTSAVYADDASLTGTGRKYAYDISDLGLMNHCPNAIYRLRSRNANETQPAPKDLVAMVDNWKRPTSDGILRFTSPLPDGVKLRIVGMAYLTQPADGDSNVTTNWTATEVSAPQDEIIIAEAAMYLYRSLISRSVASDIERFQLLLQYWQQESARRKIAYGMAPLPVTAVRSW